MTDHDHSGDELGATEPVTSVHAETVTVGQLDLPASYVVYSQEGRWFGFRTETQDVEFADEDGAGLINDALAALDDGGSVHVTAPAGGILLESDTTITHVGDDTQLMFEPGVTFRYTGDEQAVLLAGDGVTFTFDHVEAPEAKVAVRDLGLTNARVRGHELTGATKSLWLTDAENRVHSTEQVDAGTLVSIQRLDCEGTARRGVEITSAPSTTIARYEWNLGAVVGPVETGVRVGDGTEYDTARNHVVTAGVYGAGSDADRLVELNDSRNAVYLETFTPAGGQWDVVVREGAAESSVQAYTRRDELRVKCEERAAADRTKFDPVRHEVLDIELAPESLVGYEELTDDAGSTRVDAGNVVHETDDQDGGRAGIRKRMDYNFGRLNFDNAAVIETTVEIDPTDGQRAWLVWGSTEGPGVGWYVENATLYGFAHDGESAPESAATVPLIEDFETRSAWELTALYHPPTDVHFYVGDRYVSKIDRKLPSGTTDAHRILTVDLETSDAAASRLRWSHWQNRQYPKNQH